MKIAIYSGSIPSTTFIEALIKGIATSHEVVLFGKLHRLPEYNSGRIRVYPVYSNRFKNFVFTFWRTVLLLVKYPKRFFVLRQQIKLRSGIFHKYNWWSRYVAVLLYLPDVFHLQWAKDLENWFFLKERLGVKFVVSLRGAHINYSPLVDPELETTYKRYFPEVDAFHAVSKAIGKVSQNYGASARKIRVINSLIPESTLKLFRLPKPFGNNTIHMVSVGRHHWKKGYAMALNACKLLKEQGVLFRYDIIADGKVPEALLFQRRQLGLEDEVVFMEGMQQTKLFEALQDYDVLLLPSLEEGIANVVLEAMALGVPVISTDCGGMREVVVPNETGWLVGVLDSQALKDAVLDFKNASLETRQDIAKQAFNLVKTNNNATVFLDEFDDFYNIA
ncbi:glycosyltransferase family 4 protein [Snuella lapsa]|uniref:Glycosyl transferase family 1 domain-containing protein n=1 Tax=Snuella lapsa TaxID=870481 RepID=A0ABP6XSX9_9FLAO